MEMDSDAAAPSAIALVQLFLPLCSSVINSVSLM